MLNYIKVDGFKSLNDFDLEIEPGLNVLVGPNGSGKTNIISFLEFLGNLQQMSLSEAIGSIGGAGSVFTKVGVDAYNDTISCLAAGNIRLTSRKILYYRYRFEVQITEAADAIHFTRQVLQLRYRTVFTTNGKALSKYDLEVEFLPDDESETNRSQENIRINQINRDKVRERFGRQIRGNLPRFWGDPAREDSLVNILSNFFEEFANIRADLQSGKVYNIVPSKVREPDDSAREPGIARDGSGLYATLYSITRPVRHRSRNLRPRDRVFRIRPNAFRRLLSFLQLANPAIENIQVANDPFDNQLQIRITTSGETDTVLPLSAMSDGTIKWLSLISIVLTSRSFSIEEPENYLHPHMQSEVVSIIRSVISEYGFVMISTHSETLLNATEPSEVIVVSLSKGKTKASRPIDAEALVGEIQETGFGLGYYYLAGNLSDG